MFYWNHFVHLTGLHDLFKRMQLTNPRGGVSLMRDSTKADERV